MAVCRSGIRAEIIGEAAMGTPPDSNAPGRRTMNGFTIDSLRELREDTLGSNYAKTQNEDHSPQRKQRTQRKAGTY